MRRSELAALIALIAPQLRDRRSLVAVAIELSLDGLQVTAIDTPASLSATSPADEAALWKVGPDVGESALSLGVRQLRRVLAPGSPVLLACPEKGALQLALRGWFGRARQAPDTREMLCQALLLAGLYEPCLLDASGWLLASAFVPNAPDPLDAFFHATPSNRSR